MRSNTPNSGMFGQLIPHTMGSGPDLTTARFTREVIIGVSFLTDREILKALLPERIQLAGDPIVNFRFRYTDGLDWGLGGDHNAIGVSVPAAIETPEGTLRGVHWLALWEDDPMAVILGREVFGVAKLCADIHSQLDVNGEWRAVLSEEGHPMIEIKFCDSEPLEGKPLEAIRAVGSANGVIGWKQFPDIIGTDPLAGHLTYFPHSVNIDRAWQGVGEVKVFKTNPRIHIWTDHIVRALHGLPLIECVSAFRTVGSAELKVSEGRRFD